MMRFGVSWKKMKEERKDSREEVGRGEGWKIPRKRRTKTGGQETLLVKSGSRARARNRAAGEQGPHLVQMGIQRTRTREYQPGFPTTS